MEDIAQKKYSVCKEQYFVHRHIYSSTSCKICDFFLGRNYCI